MRRLLPSLCVMAAAVSCAPRPSATPWSRVHEVTPPFLASAVAADPSLAVDERGRVALSWVTRGDEGADAWLAVSADSGAHWSVPLRLNTDPGRVSSYPESRPVLAWGRGGMLVAAWAARRDAGDFADDIAVRVSPDGGQGWGAVRLVNDDSDDPLSTYHGFAALDVLPDGRLFVAWIDGRASEGAAEEPARAEIYSSTSADGGASWSPNEFVAEEVCPCCRIAVESVLHGSGATHVAVAYRGARDDFRDPRLALSSDGGATFALDTLVSADRWKLPGCPSMGPALSMGVGGGQIMWFTGESPADSVLPGRPAPGVYLANWQMGVGAVGPRRVLRDSLGNVGRPLLARLGTGTLVGAIGEAASDPPRKVLALRVLEPGGEFTPWLYLGSGVKSAAVAAAPVHGAWAAWAESAGERTRVRVARLVGR